MPADSLLTEGGDPARAMTEPTDGAAVLETAAQLEVLPSRESTVGAMRVRRALPRRGLRTVGPWCFADHMGPEQVTPTQGLDIGPHPHMGLHTVTWLLDGAVLHKDSLGSEQVIRPGQLNLMTAGRGVVHSEEAVDDYRGTLHGVQLWLAQPESARHGDPAFVHHGELPQVTTDASDHSVLVGSFAGTASPARTDGDAALGATLATDVVVRPGRSTWPLRADFEHCVIGLSGRVRVDRAVVGDGEMVALRTGRDDVVVEADEPARVLLLGGRPFDEPLLMFWNFVARSRDEVDAAYRDWTDHAPRFGDVSSTLPRIPSPRPLWAAGPRD